KDPLQLGIHYHDINHMALSAHYLSLSARQGHAVGMYLYGMALRHGWGCKVDMVEAVRLFDRAAGIVLQSLPRLAIEGGGVVARSFLPLPLYEVGICYHQGWGVPTSKSTALYYFQLAAQLGDADAQAQVGYLYLQGGNGVKRDKKRAARWLREAVKGGKRIVGEQWIWKEKWSEEGFGGVSKRRKLKRGYRQKDQ
ncbi:hypothetical protein DFS34DRAFT_579516, partial [Phlyctochytrium arcticum]